MNMQLANTFEEYAATPNAYFSIKDVPPEIAMRLPGFSDFGMDGNTMVQAVRLAGEPFTPKWSSTLMIYGDDAMKRAKIADQEANTRVAEHEFLEASFWYFLARFPFINDDAGKHAYGLHNEAYIQANKYSPYPMEIMDIPIQGKNGRVFLRLPDSTQSSFPVVMLSGGIDTWKSDLELHSLSEAFLKLGMAVLMIDVPGTGECPMPGSSTAHAWYLATIEQLKKHPRINGSSIGFYGLSLGGYWSSKLAFIAPELAGVVNNGGPVHYTFQHEWLENKPQGLKLTLANMLGDEISSDVNKAIEKIASFSLLQEKCFHNGNYAPILNINGKDDTLVTLQEIKFFDEHHIQQDTLLFSHDRHVASRNWRLHETFAAEWLAKKFKGIRKNY